MKTIITFMFFFLLSLKAIASDVDRDSINNCLLKVKDEVLKSAGHSAKEVKVGSHVYLDDKTDQWLIKTCFSAILPGSEVGKKEDLALAGCDERAVNTCKRVDEIQLIGVHSLNNLSTY